MKMSKTKMGASNPGTQKGAAKNMNMGGMAMKKKKPMSYGHGGMASKKKKECT